MGGRKKIIGHFEEMRDLVYKCKYGAEGPTYIHILLKAMRVDDGSGQRIEKREPRMEEY